VSHFKERKEKNCLNCNALVAGRYCQVCGQENIEPKESFWHMVTHFINDITHFDGKFFTTTKLLLLKPGFLPREYLRGKRASYLHPIRMYIFTSAFFFLIFFSFSGGVITEDKEVSEKNEQLISNQKKIDGIDSLITDTRDSVLLFALTNQKKKYEEENKKIDANLDVLIKSKKEKKEQPNTDTANKKSNRNSNSRFSFNNTYLDTLKTVEEYLTYQKSLPEEKKDSWIKKAFVKKAISLRNKYRYDTKEFIEIAKDKFFHSLPQMLFVSLPLFALILQVLYFRRKQFFYTDHGVFTIFHFIAVYILLLLNFAIGKINDLTGWAFIQYISFAIILFMLFYLYKSMRNFYQQRRGKTILKFILLCIFSGIITGFLTIGFMLLTFFKV
jgi:hypothetical protein